MIGLKKLIIPVKKEELTLDKIQEFLPTIIQAFIENRRKIQNSYKQYKGEHGILSKERSYGDDSKINNKIVMQNLWSMVNFKCGYEFGKPIAFSAKDKSAVPEMETFNRYQNSTNFNKLMNNIAEWVYSCGVGYSFTEPKKSADLKNYAPYESYFLSADRCAKIYSSYLAQEPLFDMIVTPISRIISNDIVEYYILSIYTNDTYYEFEYNYTLMSLDNVPTKTEERKTYKDLPIIEFSAYEDKIGIAESCESSQYALDNIISCSVDNIQETANQLLIFRNCSLGRTEDEKRKTLENAKQFGALEIADSSQKVEASVTTLNTIINHADTNVVINYILGQMYGNWGVPLSSSSVSSGNITQGGGEVANGWQNAYSVAQKELSNLLPSIKALVKQYLDICKLTPDCPITKLNENAMEIKPSIARSENMLTKTQSFTNLIEHNVPSNIAWDTCELSGDSNAIGAMIDSIKAEADRAKAQQELDINSQKADNIQTDSEVDKTQKTKSE